MPASKTQLGCLWVVVWLLGFHVLSPFKVISGRVPTCDIAHLWQLNSAAPLGDQAASTMTGYPMQPHPDTEPISPCPILIIPRTWLGSDKYRFLNHWLDLTSVRIPGFFTKGRWTLNSFGYPICRVCVLCCVPILCIIS